MSKSERIIIRYCDGTEAMVGDVVSIDERQQGVVREIIDTPEKMASWALDEFGLMFDGVFTPRGICVSIQLTLYRDHRPNKGAAAFAPVDRQTGPGDLAAIVVGGRIFPFVIAGMAVEPTYTQAN
jgi:hypothetical protein